MNNHSLAKKSCVIIGVVGLSLSMTHPGTAESVPPLQKRDLSKKIQCPGHLKTNLECTKYRKEYSLVSCPKGDMLFGGMGATDDSFQVWCGTSAQGRHAKFITCPEGSVARAGVSYMSNVWKLRCERDHNAGDVRSDLHGPFFEWYTSDGKLQSIVSGHFDSDRPIGYWLEEDASGNLTAAGKMVYSHGSTNNSENDGEWLEWDSGSWKRRYYIRGEGPWDQRQEYLQELKKRALKPK